MRARLVGAVLALVAPVALAGCGSESVLVSGQPDPGITPYDGPMHLPLDHSDDATVEARSGAAGRALECAGDPYDGGSGGDSGSERESVAGGAEEALADLVDGFGQQVPTKDYRVERRDDHRVLYSFDVADRTKAAFIAVDGVEDWKGRTGWGIESWAQCDPAEFPAEVSDGFGLDVWTDATGSRVPVTEVTSWSGPEHCGWQDITFLEIGTDPTRPVGEEEYLRDTSGELADFLDGEFDDRAVVPKGATDTGWRHDGRVLWRVPDRSATYLVSVEDPTDVERWPASIEPIGCA